MVSYEVDYDASHGTDGSKMISNMNVAQSLNSKWRCKYKHDRLM